MSIGDTLQNGLSQVIGDVEGIVRNNTVAAVSGVVVSSVLAGTVIGGIVSSKTKSNKSSKKKRGKIKHTKRGWKQDRARFNKSQKWEVAYRKRKKKHSSKRRKGKHYTKNGQPYIILASGKARFVKKTKR